jgi:essential nuclear protein 1
MEKIAAKETEMKSNLQSEEVEEEVSPFPEKVVAVYTDIGNVLSRYTAGKLSKAFKVIPSLTEWEDILYLTRPDKWTPQAMFAATKIFASNLNPRMAQRFFNVVLLDAVRADILENKKLNYHYYQSLKKSLYKPAAFFKGILIPLCRENCTLREAAIISSVLSKVSVPVAHSAVALHKISSLEYTGGQAVFIRCLLNKKYSLPMPVIGSLVKYFTLPYTRVISSRSSGSAPPKGEPLPVLWHQALLTFCERYKGSLSEKDKEGIKNVCKVEQHHLITKEIRRELFGAKGYRGEGMEVD